MNKVLELLHPLNFKSWPYTRALTQIATTFNVRSLSHASDLCGQGGCNWNNNLISQLSSWWNRCRQFITWNYRCVLFLNNWIMFNKNGTLVTIGIAWMSRLLCVLLAPCVPMVGRHTIPTTNCQLEDLDFKFQWVEVPNHLWLQAHSYFAMSPSWQNFQLVTTYDYQWPLSLGIMQAHSYFAMSPSWQKFQLAMTYEYQRPLSLHIM